MKDKRPKITLNLTSYRGYKEDEIPMVTKEYYWGTDSYPVRPRFSHFTSKQDFESAGILWVEPMTAKEIDSEEEQDKILNNPKYIVEEKFDGTRGVLHFLKPRKLQLDELEEAEKYLCLEILRGSGFEHGKNRIYERVIKGISSSELANFLRNEYGIGGGGQLNYNAMHDSKGIVVTLGSLLKPDKEFKYTWSEVANFTQWLIDEGIYYPQSAYTRLFSRRVSTKTNWFSENTDLLPQLRDLDLPELDGTIIDGEMFIPNQPFKAVASVMNCLWDEAIRRQIELGQVCFHAFDILYYKGKCVEDLPLWKRKILLASVVHAVHSPVLKMVKFYGGSVPVEISKENLQKIEKNKDRYPHLHKELIGGFNCDIYDALLSHRAYYEYIVMTGGEGVIVKPYDGKYFHKRGREYQKIKKFLTREVIIMGFSDPEKEYKGKAPETWQYWEGVEESTNDVYTYMGNKRYDRDYPVSKYYFENWVGNIRYGVIITNDEIKKLDKKKKFNIVNMVIDPKKPQGVNVIEVGECSGFDEETRLMFSARGYHPESESYLMHITDKDLANGVEECYPNDWVGEVIEVKANELFTDTGKMRHPRYLRVRPDKNPSECTWKDHIGD